MTSWRGRTGVCGTIITAAGAAGVVVGRNGQLLVREHI